MRSDYEIGFEKGPISPYAHVQVENLECEVEPEEISLRSFKVKDYLENHIWDDDGSLDSRVRMSLMDIADDFWETCKIGWVKPIDVVLTGSICNFNWSEYSDIDLHIVVDFSEVHEKEEFVQEYFDEKRNVWNDEHGKLKIYGFPVELYVEDIDAKTVSGGLYSLWENKWIRKPEDGDIKPIKLNKYAIKDIASELMTQIDDLCHEYEEEGDRHKIEEIGKKVEGLLKKIKVIRKVGLKKSEMSTGNLVYKVMRRSGYMDKLWNLGQDIYDKLNSIGEDDRFIEEITAKF